VRYRRALVETQATERNRVLKLLESANIKLSSVAADVFGVSGLAMLKALAAGTSSPTRMADLARGVLRRKLEPLALALEGRFGEHHRYLLALHLRRLEAMQAELAELEARIEERVQTFQHQRDRLLQIPGIDRSIASSILAEIQGQRMRSGASRWYSGKGHASIATRGLKARPATKSACVWPACLSLLRSRHAAH
jgi:transposase